jgi:prephenate dehydrogenase
MINRLVIFGVGLIGGSLAMALRKANYCQTIVGCSRREEHLQQAKDLGVIDCFTTDPVAAVAGADVIFLATPLSAMQAILAQIKDHIEPYAIITDGGSAKESVQRAAENVFGGKIPANFVLGHPIAGREKSGVSAAIADLYQHKKVILTPVQSTAPEALQAVRSMWEVTGAVVETLAVQQHDYILAATSHLPHILAYELVSTLAHSEVSDDIFRYAAGGFQDFTRIASSDPVMWRDICLENKVAILRVLDEFQQNLAGLRQHIEQGNGSSLLTSFEQAKRERDRIL